MQYVTFEPGHIFFRAKDPAELAFMLEEGQVELLAGEKRQRLVNAGEVFGEMSLIEERPHSMTARALSAGRCSTMSQADFETFLVSDPVACRSYLQTLFERLRALAALVPEEGVPTLAVKRAVPEIADPVPLPKDDSQPDLPVRIVVYPLTRRAAQTLPDNGLVVTKLPLRIGRSPGENEPEGMDLNDIWLMDQKPFNISRNHCTIEAVGSRIFVRDRGSYLGCGVNEERIGGPAPSTSAELFPGHNVLVVGSLMSPYQFRITIGEDA